MTPNIRHVLSIDVEEYFHVSAFQPFIDREQWAGMESRLEFSVSRLLDVFAQHEVSATFFVLGCVAEDHAGIVRRIAEAGHEIASHGWSHTRLTRLDPDQFRLEARRSKEVLEDLTQQPVLGFRAPSFSVVPGGEWAFDILIEEGYTYDSSLFPIRRRGYGYPSALKVPHVLRRPAGQILELPLTVTRFAKFRVPAAGGAYFRHFPYWLTARALREHAEWGVPAMFYLHPWEIDPDQPRVKCSPLTRWRHYGGIRRVEGRLNRLLTEFEFTSVNQLFDVDPAASLQTGAAMRPTPA